MHRVTNVLLNKLQRDSQQKSNVCPAGGFWRNPCHDWRTAILISSLIGHPADRLAAHSHLHPHNGAISSSKNLAVGLQCAAFAFTTPTFTVKILKKDGSSKHHHFKDLVKNSTLHLITFSEANFRGRLLKSAERRWSSACKHAENTNSSTFSMKK